MSRVDVLARRRVSGARVGGVRGCGAKGSSSLVGLPRLCRGALGLAASTAWAGLLRASLRVLAAQSGGAAGSRHAPLLHSGQIERRSGCFFL